MPDMSIILVGLCSAIIGAAGSIITQLILYRRQVIENDKQRAIDTTLKLIELISANKGIDAMIPPANNDYYIANFNRILQNIKRG
jgi:hypothetical protein